MLKVYFPGEMWDNKVWSKLMINCNELSSSYITFEIDNWNVIFFLLKVVSMVRFTRGSFEFKPIHGFQKASCSHISQYNIFSKFWQWIRVGRFQYACSNWYNHLSWSCSSSWANSDNSLFNFQHHFIINCTGSSKFRFIEMVFCWLRTFRNFFYQLFAVLYLNSYCGYAF